MAQQADTLTHQQIFALLKTQPGVSDWWAQSLAVKFEQQTGRRQPGQDCTGLFKFSVNKTLPGLIDDVLTLWLSAVTAATDFNAVPVRGEPRVSQTEKWRYWRCELANGTRLVVNIQQKTADKSVLSLQHEQLNTEAELKLWRSFWQAELPKLLQLT